MTHDQVEAIVRKAIRDTRYAARNRPKRLLAIETATAAILALADSEIGDLRDKVEGLDTELYEAVRVAYRRGAYEWARQNYPNWFERLQAEPRR